MMTKDAAPALPHGELREVFPDVFFVTGSLKMPGVMPIRFSRNMTVLRQGKSLTIVNSVRLNEAGLAALDALGKVERVIRIAGFHGMDDLFYKQRYGAEVWAMKGHVYVAGFNASPKPEDEYFKADVAFDETTELPIEGASLYRYASAKTPEGLLVLDREGGVVVAGDSLQNWQSSDEYFSLVGSVMMKLMGFIKPFNVGPGWLKATKTTSADLKKVLDLRFEHVLPAHGLPAKGGAKDAYRAALEQLG